MVGLVRFGVGEVSLPKLNLIEGIGRRKWKLEENEE